MQKDFFRFSIDRGGTFTDVFAQLPSSLGGGSRSLKVLSGPDSAREGIRRVLAEFYPAEAGSAPAPLCTAAVARIGEIRMGTTVATNALLERRGARMALVTTSGFKGFLDIGAQSRPRIFDLAVAAPERLYETVIECDERLLVDRGPAEDPAAAHV